MLINQKAIRYLFCAILTPLLFFYVLKPLLQKQQIKDADWQLYFYILGDIVHLQTMDVAGISTISTKPVSGFKPVASIPALLFVSL